METRTLAGEQPTTTPSSSSSTGPQDRVDVPKGMWTQCPSCQATVYQKALEESLHVCPECGYHHRISARTRIQQLVDPDTFEEFLKDLVSTNPLNFKDRIGYKDRLREVQAKTGEPEAVIVGRAFIRGRPVVLAAMDPFFIMASMGAVVGEKITSAIERAADENIPFVIVTASGGARMQEGMVSLVQMAKTSAAVAQLDDAGGLYIVVMSDPTTAGVAASFASLGDIHIAEPGAMIGFAGPRVIENTIKALLPEGFQSAEFMLEHGFIDLIVERRNLRTEIARIIDYAGK
ncbi:MAG TPA: acetyl-CoA carboxylase, carboxyltransferase subunit beta [Phycisphaerae bacterium]|nr:acetyl-CoA carboxylase, carboxyltransferase subunit beta [Phycisphaerae bacterium]HRY71041.1 acetyl-CoA carboxylase, carboxyltransferase subunit beta [Phycisphaerae bacterium]HSA29347.1 acetyl-CoA carboxylase, carboxyltransferase subunit beta [Phycisphaerae bacterium]